MSEEPRVDLPHGRAGLHAHQPAVVLDTDAAEELARVDEDVARDTLTREARAPGAEGERASGGADGRESPGDAVGITGFEHGVRDEQVVRGVVRTGESIDRSGRDRRVAAEDVGVERGRDRRGHDLLQNCQTRLLPSVVSSTLNP